VERIASSWWVRPSVRPFVCPALEFQTHADQLSAAHASVHWAQFIGRDDVRLQCWTSSMKRPVRRLYGGWPLPRRCVAYLGVPGSGTVRTAARLARWIAGHVDFDGVTTFLRSRDDSVLPNEPSVPVRPLFLTSRND